MDKIQELMRLSTKTILLTGEGISAKALPTGQLYPVKSHMAIAKLVKQEIISHVITSNIDGLHTMSGVPSEKLTELNGNTNTESCNTCGQEYFRDFNIRNLAKDLEILNTERHCDKGQTKCEEGLLFNVKCNHAMDCSVIDGEPLEIIKDADLVISLGFMYQRFECLKSENLQAKLVVVNQIVHDNVENHEVCLYLKPEKFVALIMARLEQKTPVFILHKWMKVIKFQQTDGVDALTVAEVTKDGVACSLFSQIEINGKLTNDRSLEGMGKYATEHQFVIKDMVHGRPELVIQLPVEIINKSAHVWFDMQYDPMTKTNGEWIKVICMDKDFKFMSTLKTAMIFKKNFGRDAAELDMPGSFQTRARSKSASRERSLSAGKNRSTSKGSRKSTNSKKRSSSNAGNKREQVLRELSKTRGRQQNNSTVLADEEEKKEA